MDSQPSRPSGRQQEIDSRLDAVRARLKQLRERQIGADRARTVPGERLEAAQRHAAEAHAAAEQVLASSVEAFRKAAEAHERVAEVHERTAEKGIGDVLLHKQQASLHRAAAVADWQRAKRTQSLLSDSAQPGAAVSDEPGDGVAP
jgi:hypothetical protein